ASGTPKPPPTSGRANVAPESPPPEKPRHRRDAARQQRALAGAVGPETTEDADAVPVECGPDPAPRQEPERAALDKDLKRSVVHVPRVPLEGSWQRIVPVFALDASRTPAEQRTLAPHRPAAAPHVDALRDPRLVGIEHLAEPVAEIPGADREDQAEEHQACEQSDARESVHHGQQSGGAGGEPKPRPTGVGYREPGH